MMLRKADLLQKQTFSTFHQNLKRVEKFVEILNKFSSKKTKLNVKT